MHKTAAAIVALLALAGPAVAVAQDNIWSDPAAIRRELLMRDDLMLAGMLDAYDLRDAEAFLAQPRDPALPTFLVFERTDSAPKLVGSCGLGRRPSGAIELGYWIARPHWGRGYATEASRALIDIARTLGFTRLEGSHFLDNPASGRVLEKLGFEPLGITAPRLSRARGTEAQARLLRLTLDDADLQEDAALAA